MPLAEKLSLKFHSCSRSFLRFLANCSFLDNILALHQQPKGVYSLNRNCNFYISNLAEALQVLANHMSEISQPAFGF